jgi:hypothetical protein
MIQEKPLSIADITHELNSGTATIKFILNRFSPWLPFDRIDGQQCYSRNTIPLLIKIKESLESGLLPSEIDQELKTTAQKIDETEGDATLNNHFLKQPNEDIRVSKDGLSLIKSLFDDIAIQQSRVATAHEKRAVAEERKAVAIEKRAEAEEKKAMAMNNIAMALQEMNRHRLPDSQTKEMALQAVQILAEDETKQDTDLAELNDTAQQDYSEIFGSQDPSLDLLEATDIGTDDLYDLIEKNTLLDDPLVDVKNISQDLPFETTESPLKTELKLDDLSALIESPPPQPNSQKNKEEMLELDDLSMLLEDSDELDDLSALIEASVQAPPPMILDDLSLLIDERASLAPQELDNLSLLITPDSQTSIAQASISEVPMDDLGALLDKTPSLKPDITPEENIKEYKAAVMKTILQLKTDGASPKEATSRLNGDGVQTISGKSQWSEMAISQIYKFIDSAK